LTSGGKSRGWYYALGLAYNHTDGLGERKPGNVRDSYTIPIVTLDLEKASSGWNAPASAPWLERAIDIEKAVAVDRIHARRAEIGCRLKQNIGHLPSRQRRPALHDNGGGA